MNGLEVRNESGARQWLAYLPQWSKTRKRNASLALQSSGHNIDDAPERRAAELRRFLEGRGPLYSCFALYLSSRIDLLPAEYCREFALVEDRAPALSPTEVQKTLVSEFGGRLELTFPRLDLSPMQSTLMAQYHAAELASGTPVVVAVLRDEFYPPASADSGPLQLNVELLRVHCHELLVENALADFEATLRRKADFKLQSTRIELMARDTAPLESLSVPKVYTELSSDRVLVMERRLESSVEQALASKLSSPDKLATLICKVWLQQALFGRCFPVDPQQGNITIAGMNRMGFAGCDLVVLPRRTQENLWNYLLATTSDEPDRAAMFLLKEMSQKAATRVDRESFRSSFRQSAYFGALEPVLGTDTNAFAQLVFQHWKTAIVHGYGPDPALLAFYRGMFSVARIARKLSPASDPLRYALEEVRAARIIQQVQEFADWRYLSQNIDKFITAAAHLPRALDDVLTRVSMPEDRASRSKRRGRTQGGGDQRAVLLAVMALLATVLVPRLVGEGPWASRATLLLLMMVGLLVLRGLRAL